MKQIQPRFICRSFRSAILKGLLFILLLESIISKTLAENRVGQITPAPQKLEVVQEIDIPYLAVSKKIVIREGKKGPYTAAVQLKEEIRFLNEEGNVTNTVHFPKPYGEKTVNEVFISQEGEYIGIHTVIAEESRGAEDRLSVYDISGTEIWSIKAPYYATYALAPNGQYWVAVSPPTVSPHDPPIVITKAGPLKIDNEKLLSWPVHGQYGDVYFSADSQFFTVEIDSYKDDRRQGFIGVMDHQGNPIGIFETGLTMVFKSAISPDNNHVVVQGIDEPNDKDVIQAFDMNTKKRLWEIVPNSQSLYHVAFGDKRAIFAGDRINTAFLVDLKNGETIWKISDLIFPDAFFTRIKWDLKNILLQTYSKSLNEQRLIILDQQGNLRTQFKIEDNIIDVYGLSPIEIRNSNLVLATDKGIKIAEMK